MACVGPEQRRRILPGETLTITRKDASSPWTLPGLAADQEVDPTKTSAMVSALSDLKIVGVRPKPESLIAILKGDLKDTQDVPALVSLQSKGFYVQANEVISDEGGNLAGCDDGVRYDLRFGFHTVVPHLSAVGAGHPLVGSSCCAPPCSKTC